MARLTKKKVQESIEHYSGNISAVARSFGVSRRAVYNFVKDKHPDLWEAVQEEREKWIDDAESELMRQAMEDGNTTALIFFLKTQGKSRGYTERQEITGADGEAWHVVLKWNEEQNADTDS